MNADYENQGILPRTCTCDSIKVRGKGKRSYAFSEDFEDKISLEDIDLIVRRHSLIDKELVPDLYESTDQYKWGI